jgi:hypothetical protein
MREKLDRAINNYNREKGILGDASTDAANHLIVCALLRIVELLEKK